jgi:hypothetical protein
LISASDSKAGSFETNKPAVSSVSGRLPEFKELWAAGTKSTVGLTGLDSVWFSVVTPDVEGAVFECLANYLKSRQVADGAVHRAERWLLEQSRENWRSRWPPGGKNHKPSVAERASDEAFRRLKERGQI